MRRGINVRKKKRITMNNINSKSLKLLVFLIILLIISLLIYVFFGNIFLVNDNFKKENLQFSSLNENVPFSFKKIILFSSIAATTNSIDNSMLNLDISQYCDIGIYLNNTSNTIDSLYIDNISISPPELGTPYLYKKTITDLGKCSFNEDNIINDRFDFNIIDNNSTINYENFEVFNNGSTPISLGFFNKNIRENFLTDNTEILYNGTLLKDALVTTSSLNCNISFTINIISNSDEHYLCNINLDIPLNDDKDSLLTKGYITKEIDGKDTFNFIRIK